jgi:hypothetical protein
MKKICSLAIILAVAALILGTVSAQSQINLGPSGGYGGAPFVDNVPSVLRLLKYKFAPGLMLMHCKWFYSFRMGRSITWISMAAMEEMRTHFLYEMENT